MSPDPRAPDEIPPCGCAAPGHADWSTCYCGVDDLLRIIRRRYSLAVMNAIHRVGTARYRDIAEALPRASSSTLAETLRALTIARLVDRSESGDDPPAVSYALTDSGSKLLRRLRVLLDDVQD